MYSPSEDKQNYSITIFVDSMDSWIIPWAKKIREILSRYHHTDICHNKDDIREGDFNFLLGCTGLLEKKHLDLNTHNLVIHESSLPQGKGWSPLSWQVLEGKNEIPVILFEAAEELDAGQIYLRETISLEGNELLPEIKIKQGLKTMELVFQFLETFPEIMPSPQKGTGTFYPKRTHEDDKLDIHQSIAQQFNHLRIMDNEKHPAWFEINGKKFKIKIYNYL